MIYLSEIVAGTCRKQAVSQPEFTKVYDVIVCGLGTAGSLAALFCAENGLSVLGIETLTCVGGTHSAGGVPGHYFGCAGGRYEILDEKIKQFSHQHHCPIAESRKIVTEEALENGGAEILYEASVCGVYLDDCKVVGVRVLTRDGILDCQCRILMDCTAEAHVAVMAGCETQQGRTSDGQMQPYSLVSLVFDGKDYHFTNVDFGRVNQADQKALSQAILFARSYEMAEGYAGREFIAQMPMLGIREGRRILAEETAQLDDLFADRQTDTPMFFSYADLDKHGWDIAFDGPLMGDWAIGANLGAYNVTVAVPYKALLPKNYDGILVPCRALGVDRDLSSCVRMNPDMKKAAEAAAEWATLAILQNKNLRDVPYAQLQEKLLKSGCLKESDNRGVRIDGYKNWDGSTLIPQDVHWVTDPANLAEQLQTQTPGQAIWSARRMGEKAVPTLQALLSSQDENTRKHAAFALAILGKDTGIALLRDMAIQRDGLMLKDCRKHNNLRGCMAIYWLGRLGDRAIVPELTALLCDPQEINRAVYQQKEIQTTRYHVSEFESLYFQFMSQTVMALVRIGNAHPDLRLAIAHAFTEAFSSDDYYHRITKRPKQSSEGNMVQALKTISFSTMKRWEEGLCSLAL